MLILENLGGEILLDSKQFCNLTTINLMAFVENGILNKEKMLESQKLSARAGYRVATVELELNDWDKMQSRDRLIGCSLTGYQDMVNATQMSIEEQKVLLQELKIAAVDAADNYAEELGLNKPELKTTVKPEGCWTLEFTRVLDNGILTIDELLWGIEKTNGFTEISGITCNGNKVSKVYANDTKDILKITLKNNRVLKITQSHPLSINGNWTEAQNIKIGQILDYRLGSYTKESHSELVDVTINEFRSDTRDYKTPKFMNEDLAWLIGAYLANGCLTTNERIKFHCQHLYVHEKVKKIWLEQFGVETTIIRSKDRDSYTQDFRSSKIIKWLKTNGLFKEKSFEKIPLKIRMSSKYDILSFIVGYADNDGCFHTNTFCIDSKNESFIRHLQEVGEAVGICFGFSENKQRKNSFSKAPIYKITMSKGFTSPDVIDFINKNSVKSQQGKPVANGKIKSLNPYTVKNIEILENQKTYDIEVEGEHWYYQGGLKSHNTLSLLPTVSSGVHYSHSPYYVRRVRINSSDPLLKVCEELGYPVFPEVGQDIEACKTKVIEFPVKAPDGKTKYNVSAVEQLEIYKMFMENYVEHNASNTISVRPHEWDEVIQWVYDNWDSVIGITFISLDDSFYQLLPYEAITEEEYTKRVSEMKPFIPSLISKYEIEEVEIDTGNDGCSSGICPIR